MNKILFIQTGGTIDKGYPKKIGGYAFEIEEPAFERILHKVNFSDFRTESVSQKDSQNITDEDRKNLVEICKNAPEDKIIITHGTDTIIETAKSLTDLKNKTIVLTGAFLPERFQESDADFNIGFAMGVCSAFNGGIYIAIGGKVFPADRCFRDSETGSFYFS
jgi:L-asparaginase